MGVQQSIQLGNAKIDANFDYTNALYAALLKHPFRNSGSASSLVRGSGCARNRRFTRLPESIGYITEWSDVWDEPVGRRSSDICHKRRFIRPGPLRSCEKLDVSFDKGLYDISIFAAFRKPRPEWLSQQTFFVQGSVSPEIGILGVPGDNFSRSGSGGINLCRLSAGLDLSEPASSNWSNKTSIKFEHICPFNDYGYSINRDSQGFPVTCSGGFHDSMVVIKQESRFAKADARSFTKFTVNIEQGIPLLSKWLIFNRFKFVASKGIRLGPGFLQTSLTGGSVVGDIAPYQAFAIGGLGSVRGYGEGAVGSGRSCVVANSEFSVPLNQVCEGTVFLDCGTDLGSSRHVPGNPALRQGKPGSGVGLGCGFRFKTPIGHLEVDYSVNALDQRSVYFAFSRG